MNVIEAYIKYHGQLIILVSGLSACGKTILAQNLSSDFKIPMIKQREFYKKDYNKTVKLSTDKEIIEWDSNDAIDWDKLNDKIAKEGMNGIVLVGTAFPKDKITFRPEYHFHVSVSKQNCLDQRGKVLEENKDKYPQEYEEFKDGTAKLVMDEVTYPYYKKSIEESIINKFFNSNKFSQNEMTGQAFDMVIELIEKFLYKDRKNDKDDTKEKDDSKEKYSKEKYSKEKNNTDKKEKYNAGPKMKYDSKAEYDRFNLSRGVNNDKREKLGRPFDTTDISNAYSVTDTNTDSDSDIKTEDVSMYDRATHSKYKTESINSGSDETEFMKETDSEEYMDATTTSEMSGQYGTSDYGETNKKQKESKDKLKKELESTSVLTMTDSELNEIQTEEETQSGQDTEEETGEETEEETQTEEEIEEETEEETQTEEEIEEETEEETQTITTVNTTEYDKRKANEIMLKVVYDKKMKELRQNLEHKTKAREISEKFTEEASSSNTSTTDPMAKIVKPDKNSSSSYELDEPSEELVPDKLIEVYHTPEGFNYR